VLHNKRDPKLLRQESCKGVEKDSWAEFGKETLAGAHRRPEWVLYYGAQAGSERAQDAQALLRHDQAVLRHAQALLSFAQACSGSAHPQLRLKQQLLTFGD
jgi:hypothetical protein